MIRDVGNIELCELLETEPKTQCTVCLSYWNIGILYCTCGHFLHKERGANHQFINYTMDLLSVPEYVIKKGRPHGRTLTEINNGLKVLLHGGIGKVHGGLLIPMKVTMEMNQVLTEQGDLLYSIWNNSSGQDFFEFNYFVTAGSLTADAVYCNRRGCKHNTLNDMFSRCKSVQ